MTHTNTHTQCIKRNRIVTNRQTDKLDKYTQTNGFCQCAISTNANENGERDRESEDEGPELWSNTTRTQPSYYYAVILKHLMENCSVPPQIQLRAHTPTPRTMSKFLK